MQALAAAPTIIEHPQIFWALMAGLAIFVVIFAAGAFKTSGDAEDHDAEILARWKAEREQRPRVHPQQRRGDDDDTPTGIGA